ncbi:hypothetical protein [Caenispirillum salinarum]
MEDLPYRNAWQEDAEEALMNVGFERPRDRTRGLHHYGLNIACARPT